MSLLPLDCEQEKLSEKELNTPENAPEEITRYAYNAKDLKGIRFTEAPMSVFGGIKYIREDLVTRGQELPR